MEMGPNPFDVFVEEHNHGLAALEKMEQGADSLLENGYSAEALSLIREANEFIKTEVKAHNQKEEDALFPVLGPHMPSPSIIDVIVAEHRDLWDKEQDLQSLLASILGDHEELWAEEDRLEALLNSSDAADKTAAITTSAYNIIYMLRDHIDKENQILFPSAQSILNEAEVAEVAKKMGL
jgi:hemerythrin-like domain-containing protein